MYRSAEFLLPLETWTKLGLQTDGKQRMLMFLVDRRIISTHWYVLRAGGKRLYSIWNGRSACQHI